MANNINGAFLHAFKSAEMPTWHRNVLTEAAKPVSMAKDLLKALKSGSDVDSKTFGKITIVSVPSKDIKKMKTVTLKTSKNISDADYKEAEAWILSKGYDIPASIVTGSKKIVFTIGKPKELKESVIAIPTRTALGKDIQKWKTFIKANPKFHPDDFEEDFEDFDEEHQQLIKRMTDYYEAGEIPEETYYDNESQKAGLTNESEEHHPVIAIPVGDEPEDIDNEEDEDEVEGTKVEELKKLISKTLSDKLPPGNSDVHPTEVLGSVNIARDDDDDLTTFHVSFDENLSNEESEEIAEWLEAEGFAMIDDEFDRSFSFGLHTDKLEAFKEEGAVENLEEAKKDDVEDKEEMTIEKAAEFLKAAFDEDDLVKLHELLFPGEPTEEAPADEPEEAPADEPEEAPADEPEVTPEEELPEEE